MKLRVLERIRWLMSRAHHEMNKWPTGQVAIKNFLLEVDLLQKESFFLFSHSSLGTNYPAFHLIIQLSLIFIPENNQYLYFK